MVKTMIPLEHPENENFELSKYTEHTCHDTPRDSISGKYMIKIPRFDSGTPEEWIIFVDIVQKIFVRQNVTAVPLIYKCMERVLKGDAEAELTQQVNLVWSYTTKNFTTVLATMTVYLFTVLIYEYQNLYMYKCTLGRLKL